VGYLLFPLRHESPLWRAFLFGPAFVWRAVRHKKTRSCGFCRFQLPCCPGLIVT
jgi:hypothetical protein